MELPLFPLNTVLFPGATIPLHIFEDRYKQMIAHVRPGAAPLRRRPHPRRRGGRRPREPYDIGTTAHVTSVQHLEDGKHEPHVRRRKALPHPFDKLRPTVSRRRSRRAAHDRRGGRRDARPRRHRRSASSPNSSASTSRCPTSGPAASRLPAEPDRLADYIASRLAIDFWTKQDLLEELSARNRLSKEIGLLSDAIQEMTPRVESVRAARWQGFAMMN